MTENPENRDLMKSILTRVSRRIVLLGVALALSLACGGVAVGAGLILDPEKQAIIDNATVVPAPIPPDVRSYRDPLPDAGTAADIAAVKRDVVAAIQRDREIMRPTAVPANLRDQLAEIYGLGVLDDVTRETTAAMNHAAEDPEFRTYAENRLTVTQWQGVQVSTPVTAVATFLAYESWRGVGSTTWENDQLRQYQIILVKEIDKWKLVDEAAFDPDERRPLDRAETPSDGLPRMP